jgi:hypothetical protein
MALRATTVHENYTYRFRIIDSTSWVEGLKHTGSKVHRYPFRLVFAIWSFSPKLKSFFNIQIGRPAGQRLG